MSTVTLVTCDGCGESQKTLPRRAWIAITAERIIGLDAYAPCGNVAVERHGGGIERSSRFDYCSVECAAKHLGRVKA